MNAQTVKINHGFAFIKKNLFDINYNDIYLLMLI